MTDVNMNDAEGRDEEAENSNRRPTRVDGVGLIAVAGVGAQAPELAAALERAHAVRVIRSLDGASEALSVLAPDTVVVGHSEGVSAAQSLIVSARRLEIPMVLALIDAPDARAVDLALYAGAHDVVSPPHTADDILVRRRVLMRTRGPADDPTDFPNRRVMLGPLTLDLTMRQVLDGGEPLTLTGREFELLIRLMQDQGKVVPRQRIIDDIWGTDKGSEAVLDATVHRLRRKLQRKVGDEKLVSTVRGVGYRVEAGTFKAPHPIPGE